MALNFIKDFHSSHHFFYRRYQRTAQPTSVISAHKPDNMNAPAAQAILGAPELLEAILLQIPCLQLFTTQRVSKSWHAAAVSSPRLQGAMFLRPTRPPLGPKNSANGKGAPNQIVGYINPEATALSVYNLLSAASEHVYLNPFLLRNGRFQSLSYNHNTSNISVTTVMGRLEKDWPDIKSGKNSWETMLLISTPLARPIVVAYCQCFSDHGIFFSGKQLAGTDRTSHDTSDESFTLWDSVAWVLGDCQSDDRYKFRDVNCGKDCVVQVGIDLSWS